MSGSRRHIAVDLGASGGRVIEVVVSEESIATRVLHRFANAPVATARAGNLRLCWPFERIFEEILEGLRRAAWRSAARCDGPLIPAVPRR